MSDALELPADFSGWRLSSTADYVAGVQREDGLIPWYADGPADPWDHVESAMGLSVAGRYRSAEAAYRWLLDTQLDDGSWWATYAVDDPNDRRKETHRTAYVATGVWHHYQVTGDRAFLWKMWPAVRRALEFTLDHRGPAGEVFWAVDDSGDVYRDALISGCSSIYRSLACGAAIARTLDRPRPTWETAQERLGTALRAREDCFDRTWESKGRFAMDWFYPVLSGAITGEPAAQRLDERMSEFLQPGLGCRCVADEPWVTVAESCELVIALLAAGRRRQAAAVFDWLSRWLDEDGGFWTGYQFEDGEIWPREKPTWTAGSALLAADALSGFTAASSVFTDYDVPPM